MESLKGEEVGTVTRVGQFRVFRPRQNWASLRCLRVALRRVLLPRQRAHPRRPLLRRAVDFLKTANANPPRTTNTHTHTHTHTLELQMESANLSSTNDESRVQLTSLE